MNAITEPVPKQDDWRRYAEAIHRAATLNGLAEAGSIGELSQLVLGLVGEAGEVAAEIESGGFVFRRALAIPALAEELADVAIYANIAAVTLGLDASGWRYGRQAATEPPGQFTQAAWLALRLNAAAGQVANTFKKVLRGDRPLVAALPDLRLHLAETSARLDALAAYFQIDLEMACRAKMVDLRERWPDYACFMPAADRAEPAEAAS